jgi:hypothetical protein
VPASVAGVCGFAVLAAAPAVTSGKIVNEIGGTGQRGRIQEILTGELTP